MTSRQRPRSVQPGATLGIVAPSSPGDPQVFQEAVALLESWGYKVKVGPNALARNGWIAGTDEQRAADFNALWADPEVDAVLAARGGYGAMRILDLIRWDLVRANPKFFIGFSDITALHCAMQRKAGQVSFHGPMPAAFGYLEYSAAGLRRALTSAAPLGEIPLPPGTAAPPVPELVTFRPGVAEGPIMGGNLTLLSALMGTPYEPDLDGHILLIEDVDELPRKVDRMLVQLRLAGKLRRVAGILFGDSPSCMHGPEGTQTLFDVIRDQLLPLGVPVLYGFPCGHTPYRATIPLGVPARLDATAGTLTLLEPALV